MSQISRFRERRPPSLVFLVRTGLATFLIRSWVLIILEFRCAECVPSVTDAERISFHEEMRDIGQPGRKRSAPKENKLVERTSFAKKSKRHATNPLASSDSSSTPPEGALESEQKAGEADDHTMDPSRFDVILFVALRTVSQDEELTFDYNRSPQSTSCACGVRHCRGAY